MPAYLFANLTVQDPAGFAAYRDLVAPMIAQYGGRYLVRGGAVTVVEGDPGLDRVVILEFPDRAMLDAFYHGPDYAPLIAMRAGATLSRVALIDGYTT